MTDQLKQKKEESEIDKEFCLEAESTKFRTVMPGDIILIYVNISPAFVTPSGEARLPIKKAYCFYDKNSDCFRDINTLQNYEHASSFYTLIAKDVPRFMKNIKKKRAKTSQLRLKFC